MTHDATEGTNNISNSDERDPSENSQQESWTLYSVEFEMPDATETLNKTTSDLSINQHPAELHVITDPATRTSARIRDRRDRGLVKSYASRRQTVSRNMSYSDRETSGATTPQTSNCEIAPTAAETNTRLDDNEMTKKEGDHITNDVALHSEADVTITTDNANAELTDDEIIQRIKTPTFTARDYMDDAFFRPIDDYLNTIT